MKIGLQKVSLLDHFLPFPLLQPLQRPVSECLTFEVRDFVAEGEEHAFDLMKLAFAESKLERVRIENRAFGRERDAAVIERDTFDEADAIFVGNGVSGRNEIGFPDVMFGGDQAMQECAVTCSDKKSFRIDIESSGNVQEFTVRIRSQQFSV